MDLARRDLLKLGLLGSAALALPGERLARTKLAVKNRIPAGRLPKPFTLPFTRPPVLAPSYQDATTDYYLVDQIQANAEIIPGLRTPIWGYNGITPGPTIVVNQGRKVVVRQCNELPDLHPTLRYKPWTSTHLHGSASLPQYDGYASDVTSPQDWKDYQYPNFQEARTLWYHDHGVHHTATNAYMGLAAMYIMHDAQERALPIPHGHYDVPLILRDAMFEKSGALVYDDNSESSVMGDVILVNGRPWPTMQVERRKYRFRVLNAAISRSFDISLSTGDPFSVIATDGGLMPAPAQVTSFRSGMAERYEIVIDFARYKVGQRVVLRNGDLPNNIEYDNTHLIMAFDVVGDAADTRNNEVPSELNPHHAVMALKASDAERRRHFAFERGGGQWTINGVTWDDVVNSDYSEVVARVPLGATEIWELENRSGGWFHPVHIHLVDFKVLDRNGKPPLPYEKGPKDVVYVGENETVRVIAKFGPHKGRYMMHCHNLVHEDHDMMAQFCVGDSDVDGDDPIKADMPRPLPSPVWGADEDED